MLSGVYAVYSPTGVKYVPYSCDQFEEGVAANDRPSYTLNDTLNDRPIEIHG